jgi:3-oxoacyl-[acyl-carrier-protein] synthase II
MIQGRSGIGRIKRFNASKCITQIGGELPDSYYALESAEFNNRLIKQTSGTTRLGYLVAKEAMADSGFSVTTADPYRCAVITGSGVTSNFEEGEAAIQMLSNPPKFIILQQMANAISAWISIKFGFKGPTYNVATACASGSFAVAAGYQYIASGAGDAALVLGADMMLTTLSLQGFNHLGALSERNDQPEKASRPFDLNRTGFVLANGGAALLLEKEDSARKRNARIYAYVSGVGLCSEAYNIVAPNPTGDEMAKVMTMAVEDAGIPRENIGYISAHGTSTIQNDHDETVAVKRAFGEHARKIAMSSQKSMTGHTIGGAGGIEAAVTALSLHHGVLTPTINHETPDPECDLDYVPNVAREAKDVKAALSNSFGFGGHNSSILFEKV